MLPVGDPSARTALAPPDIRGKYLAAHSQNKVADGYADGRGLA